MQTADQCIAALDEGREISAGDFLDMVLESNPGLEDKVEGDEEMFMVLAQALDNMRSEHIQLKNLEICGKTKSGPVVRKARRQNRHSDKAGLSRRQQRPSPN
jgi:hypothetical protein